MKKKFEIKFTIFLIMLLFVIKNGSMCKFLEDWSYGLCGLYNFIIFPDEKWKKPILSMSKNLNWQVTLWLICKKWLLKTRSNRSHLLSISICFTNWAIASVLLLCICISDHCILMLLEKMRENFWMIWIFLLELRSWYIEKKFWRKNHTAATLAMIARVLRKLA